MAQGDGQASDAAEKAQMTLQAEVTEWAASVFGDPTPKAKILHLWEELEEAFAEAWHAKVMFEIADCGLITMHLASSLGIELPEPSKDFARVLRVKLEVCQRRKWGKPDSNGVVRHVE